MKLIHSFQTRIAGSLFLLMLVVITLVYLTVKAATEASAVRQSYDQLDTGARVAYRDVRRFGTWELLEDGHLRPYLDARLGPEPLGASFSSARLGASMAGRRAPVKAFLLDQRRVAGIGNIYADEALWRARIHPLRPAGELDAREVARIHRAVRAALRRGVELQGSTLRDYVTPDGDGGGMQHEFHVYGRLDEPCDRCGRPIERIVVGGRGTWFCPRCQRL